MATRAPAMTATSSSLVVMESPSVLGAARAAAGPKPAEAPRSAAPRSYATEWLALIAALAIVGVTITYALAKAHQSVDAIERDRLQVQARVIDENVGQQLDGINRALTSVRDDFLGTPARSVPSLISTRLKALSDAIPGVRSMVLLDADGTVAATSVDTLLGRDYSSRDFFNVAKTTHNPAMLHVAAPYKTSLGNYTVMFARAIIGPSGSFEGVVAAALEPEYFEVLMRSVLYAPDMWVSLGHSDGKVFVTMPDDATHVDSERQVTRAALAAAPGTPGGTALVVGAIGGTDEQRMTALGYLSPPDLHMDKPLITAVSRAMPEIFRAWRQQAIEYATFYALLCAAACFGLYRGQWRRQAFAGLQARAERERRHSAEQLELALQGADLGLWDWDLHDDRFNHNEVTRRQLGFAPGDIGNFGEDWRRLIHPADTVRVLAAVEAHFRGESPAYECEFRVRHKRGHWVWLLSRGKVVERDAFGIAVRVAGTHMDLSRRKHAEAELERTAEMLRRTGELAHIGGWELDLATMQVDWTEQVYRIHEVEPGTMPRLEDSVDFFAKEAQPAIRSAIDNAAENGTPYDLELPFVTAKGNPRWVRAQGLAVIEDGKPVRLLGAFQDITERKTISLEMHRLNEQLTRLSTTDSLTGVGNRRLFDQTLKSEWARASRRNESVGLLMIDIDHFKEYNDHYGHPAGDACLRQVARMVGEAVRRGGELVARYGGEEFALLMPGAGLDDARRAAERCAQIVADAKIEHRASNTSAWVTVSIGAASQAAAAGVDCGLLVEIADAALYRAKRCGRGRIEY